jgi:hypothetical protein
MPRPTHIHRQHGDVKKAVAESLVEHGDISKSMAESLVVV